MGWRPSKCEGCQGLADCRLPGGVCIELQRMPTPRWNADFAAAVEVYFRTVRLSGCDMNGNPLLTMLETVLRHSDYEIDDDSEFMEYIAAIHEAVILTRSQR